MKQEFKLDPVLARYLATWVPFALIYFIIFLATSSLSAPWAMMTALTNISVPLLVGIVIFPYLVRHVYPRPERVQIPIHSGLAIMFSMIWYLALSGQLSVLKYLQDGEWIWSPFMGSAFLWQLYQGVTIYLLIAGGGYIVWLHSKMGKRAPGVSDDSKGSRLFVRNKDGHFPVEFEDIIVATGADDYSEITHQGGTHLARISLIELEKRFDSKRFVRVHRSHIVNMDMVSTIEPASNGRLSVIMKNGVSIPASRSGARKIKPLIV